MRFFESSDVQVKVAGLLFLNYTRWAGVQGWVRDFEKALKIQWEIYANGLLPMHIVVGRSDHLYGTRPLF